MTDTPAYENPDAPPPPPTSQPRSRGAVYTSLPPARASTALAQALTSRGAQVTTRTENMITGLVRVTKRPSTLVAFVLAIFFVLPAIIYLVVGRKDDTFPFSIAIESEGTGSRVVLSGKGEGLRVARTAAKKLPT